MNGDTQQDINITDTDPTGSLPWIGTRLFGQKSIPGRPDRCLTMLWSSLFNFPLRPLGTFEMSVVDRNDQNRWPYSGKFTPKPKTFQGIPRPKDPNLVLWTYMAHWIPTLLSTLGLIAAIGYLTVSLIRS